uniref:Uncharacterized protein n=1 Tax=Picea sitchensis TaxID=3332 RepID=A9NM49_PICSI|nr:unknown [Picea sitchensis]
MAVAAFGKKIISILHPHIITSYSPSAATAVTSSISMRGRRISSQDSLISRLADELEDLAEERRIIMGAPDWIPFLPGSSYWLPDLEHYKTLLLKQQEEDEDEGKETMPPRDTSYLVLLESSSDSEN